MNTAPEAPPKIISRSLDKGGAGVLGLRPGCKPVTTQNLHLPPAPTIRVATITCSQASVERSTLAVTHIPDAQATTQVDNGERRVNGASCTLMGHWWLSGRIGNDRPGKHGTKFGVDRSGHVGLGCGERA